jgi:hypothetical protein
VALPPNPLQNFEYHKGESWILVSKPVVAAAEPIPESGLISRPFVVKKRVVAPENLTVIVSAGSAWGYCEAHVEALAIQGTQPCNLQ